MAHMPDDRVHCHENYEVTLDDHDRRLRRLEQRGEKTLDMLTEIKLMMVEHIAAHKGGDNIWGKVVAYVITAIVGALLASAGFIFREVFTGGGF